VRFTIFLAAALGLLVACGNSGSPAPQGWQPLGGVADTWVTGSGADQQQYFYNKAPFSGALSVLASRVTIDVLMRNRGAKLEGSLPFGACPGEAGIATFGLSNGSTVEVGFTVHDGQAIRTQYARPKGAPVDPNVKPAMQSVLCTSS